MAMIDGSDEQMLARDMIEVHGMQAAAVARGNARAAALAAQIPHAKSWIRVLGSSNVSRLARHFRVSQAPRIRKIDKIDNLINKSPMEVSEIAAFVADRVGSCPKSSIRRHGSKRTGRTSPSWQLKP
jgi:hypothetical protein